MFNSIFQSVLDSSSETLDVSGFIICIGVSILIGIFLAFMYAFRTKYTKSFVITLAMLPAVVCTVIMMVNGNIGAGVAVAGTFSLVRFRSVPGSARDIGSIFMAMASGLIAGMGYLGFAILFTLIMGIALMIFTNVPFEMGKKRNAIDKTLKITIPEDLDYYSVFDDTFEQYTTEHSLVSSKTTNMGSMFKLIYNISLKDPSKEKEFVDALRCQNGNLEIAITRQEVNNNEL